MMTHPESNPRPQTTPTSPESLAFSARPVNPSIPAELPSNFSPQDGSATKTFAILTLAAIGMATLLSLLPAVGHDQLWCLYVAQRMLHGTTLYGPELLESNPPLIMAMLTIPTALASLLHLPVTLLFKLGVLLTSAVSALLSLQILRRLQYSLPPVRLWSLAFAFITVFAILPARDLGQRDHLLALLCLPYVLAAGLDFSRAEVSAAKLSLATRLAIGVLAGIGICLKPHHALIPLAIECALLMETRSLRQLLRPTLLALVATGIAFLAGIRLFTPAYLTDILPLLRDVYWAIGHLSPVQLFVESIQLHILAAASFFLFLIIRRHPGGNLQLSALLMLAGVASTIAYYVQGTGWYYQQIPALSFFALALWLLLIELATMLELSAPTWMPRSALALSTLALVLTAYFSGYTLSYPLSFPTGLSDTPDPTFFTGLPPGSPVAILSTVVDDTAPPIATHNFIMAQRTNNLWVLPAILRNEDPQGQGPLHVIAPARLTELDRLQHRWMVDDLNHWQPSLILILRCEDPKVSCQILEDRHDNLLAWFQRDPIFRETFSHYHFLRSSGPYDAYVLTQ